MFLCFNFFVGKKKIIIHYKENYTFFFLKQGILYILTEEMGKSILLINFYINYCTAWFNSKLK